jgi:hypothetical protein
VRKGGKKNLDINLMFVCKPNVGLLSVIVGQMILLYVKGYSYLVCMYNKDDKIIGCVFM